MFWSPVKEVQVVKHAIPTPNSCPHDIHSIPGDSVVLPFGTLVDNSHGGVLKEVPSVSWLLDSVVTAWGLFNNLDSCPL